MAAKRKVYGPYRVKDIGVNAPVYEIVARVGNQGNTWEELRPRVTYAGKEKRPTAFAKCLRLNKRYVQEAMEAGDFESIKYWEKATN